MLHVVRAYAAADAGWEEPSRNVCISGSIDDANGLLGIACICQGCALPARCWSLVPSLGPKGARDRTMFVFHLA